jgi:hypothetical protein
MGPLLKVGSWAVGLWVFGKVLDRLGGPSDGQGTSRDLPPGSLTNYFNPGVADWFPWSAAPDVAPTEKGVYLMRSLRRGPEPVVYIGRAANHGGIRQRLMQYRSPGHSNSTSIRIRDLCQRDGFIEVGWIVAPNPAVLEAELLDRFKQANGELPLWNKLQPRLP